MVAHPGCWPSSAPGQAIEQTHTASGDPETQRSSWAGDPPGVRIPKLGKLPCVAEGVT